MYHVSVLAYDGVFASALTGVMDLLNLTGVTWNRIHGQPLNRQFKVQMVSRGGEPVRCTAGMRIAVIDTGLDYTHSMFAKFPPRAAMVHPLICLGQSTRLRRKTCSQKICSSFQKIILSENIRRYLHEISSNMRFTVDIFGNF